MSGSVAIGNGSGGSDIAIDGSSGNTVGGTIPSAHNVISGAATGNGVNIFNSGSTGNVVVGNLIGTDATGTVALANQVGVSITISGGDNTIGGTTTAAGTGSGNLILGSSFAGIYLYDETTTDTIVGNAIVENATGLFLQADTTAQIGGTNVQDGNLISGNGTGVNVDGSANSLIEGNLIGTDITGTSAHPNSVGIAINSGSTKNTIGGTAAGAGNVISGNAGDGVSIVSATSNLIAGNWIGTNALGTAALGNTGDGVYLNQATGNTIGGTSPTSANLISGNTNGVELNDASSNYVQGNMIGTDTTGTLAIGNKSAGVLVDAGSSSNTIGGPVGGSRNVISGNVDGIAITGSTTTSTLVAGNLIGTDVTGTLAVPNTAAGVTISGAAGTTIGGTTVLARNVISANTGDGVDVASGATGTWVLGNFIGVDQTGTQPLGNTGSGVFVSAAPGTTIGGTAAGAGNVISANTQSGVSIGGGAASGIAVVGNFVGTDLTGTLAVGNAGYGIAVSDPPGVTIGGTGAGARNVISGNKGAGIGLLADATDELIEGNFIGTDITGSNPLGNGTGILIDGGSGNNTIGGSAAAGNTIAYSTGIGVDVDATAGTGNEIRFNSIFSNTKLGIDLGGDGPTLNTPGGPHTGPNDDQNYPVITGLTSAGGMTTVSGTFNSTPSTTFALDFFTMSSYNLSEYGEGRYLLGTDPLMTDASGNAMFSFAFPTPAGGAAFRLGDGDRPQWQYVGVCPRLRRRHAADSRHRLCHAHGRRGSGRTV